MKYRQGIVGGTFDRLHMGHQKLIDAAFANSMHVTIGISLPKLYQHKLLSNSIQSYQIREQAIKEYLKEKHFDKRTTIIPIEDIFGNTLTQKQIDAIFVTEENVVNVEVINTKRQEIGFATLEVIVVPYVMAEDDEKITSERIRMGLIDRDGHSFWKYFSEKRVLHLPEELRTTLREPIGLVADTIQKVLPLVENKILITVGDIVTQSTKDNGRIPDISIIDFMTRRNKIKFYLTPWGRVKNKAATIEKKAVEILLQKINEYVITNKPQTLVIAGEEDLLALPAILLAPLESVIIYGQFDRGIVINEVTEEKKKEVEKLLRQFY